MISTTPTVICSVINKQHWSHKCGCQYIHYNFRNSTGRLGPIRGRKCYVTLAFSGVPNKGDKIRS